MSDHALLMKLHTEIDALVEKLEHVCFDPKAPADATLSARIRRQQLISVRSLLLGRVDTLTN